MKRFNGPQVSMSKYTLCIPVEKNKLLTKGGAGVREKNQATITGQHNNSVRKCDVIIFYLTKISRDSNHIFSNITRKTQQGEVIPMNHT